MASSYSIENRIKDTDMLNWLYMVVKQISELATLIMLNFIVDQIIFSSMLWNYRVKDEVFCLSLVPNVVIHSK